PRSAGSVFLSAVFLSLLAAQDGGWGAVFAKVFFAAIAEPDTKDLGDLLLLRGSEPLVEGQCPAALEAAGAVAMGVPMRAGQAEATGGLLDQFGTAEFVIRLAFLGHAKGRSSYL